MWKCTWYYSHYHPLTVTSFAAGWLTSDASSYRIYKSVGEAYLESHKNDFDKLKNQFPRCPAFSTILLTRVHEVVLEASSELIGIVNMRRHIHAVTHATRVTDNILQFVGCVCWRRTVRRLSISTLQTQQHNIAIKQLTDTIIHSKITHLNTGAKKTKIATAMRHVCMNSWWQLSSEHLSVIPIGQHKKAGN